MTMTREHRPGKLREWARDCKDDPTLLIPRLAAQGISDGTRIGQILQVAKAGKLDPLMDLLIGEGMTAPQIAQLADVADTAILYYLRSNGYKPTRVRSRRKWRWVKAA